ncbi:EAL domain-containing protein [Neptuniibacter sp. SY11_33]|uniref:bifunctional diguanylate cyclase/phosphodiesterase n=1 Tax=Neptuniibacter sp. SY11_33 TaxID=3398215 RepID=UPI0039F4C408
MGKQSAGNSSDFTSLGDTKRKELIDNKLSRFLAIAIVVLTIAPIVVFYSVLSQVANETITETVEHELEEKAHFLRRSIDRYYSQRAIDIRNISQADVLERNDLDAISQYIEEITENSPSFLDIEIADLNGEIISNSSEADDEGRSIYELYPELRQLISKGYNSKQGDVFISSLIILDDGSWGSLLITPVTDDSNTHVIKLLIVELHFDDIQRLLLEVDSIAGHTEHTVGIVDKTGKLILSNKYQLTNQKHTLAKELDGNEHILSKYLKSDDKTASYLVEHPNGESLIISLSAFDSSNIAKVLNMSVMVSTPYDQAIAPIATLEKTTYSLALILGCIIFSVMIFGSRKVMAMIHYEANFDPITLLPNRRLFNDRLQQALSYRARESNSCSLLYLDLDRFKEVNDSLGHVIGDKLLRSVAQRLQDQVRKSDNVARIGGDEFAIILRNSTNTSHIDRVAKSIIDTMSEPFLLEGHSIFTSASIGIAVSPGDGVTAPELMISADQALACAKMQGKNKFLFFTREMQCASTRRHKISTELRKAIPNGEFQVYYQPIVATNGSESNHKLEALIRWEHPELGFISPIEFIPIAEETHFISELGDWVFLESLKFIHEGLNKLNLNLEISINVSPIQLKLDNIPDTWSKLLDEYEVPGSSITVEITEGVLMVNDPTINNQLIALRDNGMKISLDDFGTGYSSLAYLKKFNIDILKIDKAFVDELASDGNDLALCEAIVAMSHTLGIKVIAEGVETKVQADLLHELKSDYCQGYYFSKPAPKSEIISYLEQKSAV